MISGQDIARRAMIENQLRPSGVNANFVLQRMAQVPRENFVPAEGRGFAYMDRAVPLGDGRWLAAPLVHGLMLQEARPQMDDRALVVDGGSGYLPELIRPLVGSLGVMDAGQIAEGGDLPSAAGGFTLLLIDGAVEHIPASLTALLAPAARAVTGVLRDGVTRMAVGRLAGGEIALLPVAELGIPVLPEFCLPQTWSFRS